MIDPELKKHLEKEGIYEIREIPNKGICGLFPLFYTVGLGYGLDWSGRKGRYCYPLNKANEAVLAITTWDGVGDPSGDWVKHKGIGIDLSNPNLK